MGKDDSNQLRANLWPDPYAWVLVCPSCIYRVNENCTAEPTEWVCTPQCKKKLCERRPFEVWLRSYNLMVFIENVLKCPI